MEVIKELVRNIVLITLLTAFLDMLLPSSNMRPYLKMIMGLFIIVTVLNPVLNFLSHHEEFEVFAWQQDNSAVSDEVIRREGEELAAINQGLFLQEYARRIEVQMAALCRLIPGVADIEIRVKLKGGQQVGSYEGIHEVWVRVAQDSGNKPSNAELIRIEPVKIGNPTNPGSHPSPDSAPQPGKDGLAADQEKRRIGSEIKKTLSQYFGVMPEKVTVVF